MCYSLPDHSVTSDYQFFESMCTYDSPEKIQTLQPAFWFDPEPNPITSLTSLFCDDSCVFHSPRAINSFQSIFSARDMSSPGRDRCIPGNFCGRQGGPLQREKFHDHAARVQEITGAPFLPRHMEHFMLVIRLYSIALLQYINWLRRQIIIIHHDDNIMHITSNALVKHVRSFPPLHHTTVLGVL